MKKLEEYVRSIPDFPEPGIIFRDVTSILQDADGLCLAVDSLIDMVKDLDYDRLPMRSIRVLCLCAKRESFPVRPFPWNMTWNTDRQPLKCTRTPSARARR